jgi:hypothetical protein
MIDSFVLLAPLLLLPIVALVAFVGCDLVFGLDRVDDPLSTPTGFTATPGNNKVVLSWNEVENAAAYLVRRGTVSGTYQSPFDSTKNTTFTDTTAMNGITYYYIVIALHGTDYNDSGPSAEVSATPSTAALIPFLTPATLTTLASVTGWYGMAIQVGASDLSVQTLGRIVAPGNSQIHVIKIVNADGTDVPNAFVSVNLAGGTPGEFKFGALNPAVTLQAGATYYILSQELAGTDQFYNHTSTVTTTDVAVLTSAARGGPPYVTDSDLNKPYGPVNFQY